MKCLGNEPITGLKLMTPLKKSLRSREEIRAYVIKQMNEEKKMPRALRRPA